MSIESAKERGRREALEGKPRGISWSEFAVYSEAERYAKQEEWDKTKAEMARAAEVIKAVQDKKK